MESRYQKSIETYIYNCQLLTRINYHIFKGPEYLTVSSSGPAGEKQASRMGDFRLTYETHNQRPVWASLNQKLYYNKRKFTFIFWLPKEEEDFIFLVMMNLLFY